MPRVDDPEEELPTRDLHVCTRGAIWSDGHRRCEGCGRDYCRDCPDYTPEQIARMEGRAT